MAGEFRRAMLTQCWRMSQRKRIRRKLWGGAALGGGLVVLGLTVMVHPASSALEGQAVAVFGGFGGAVDLLVLWGIHKTTRAGGPPTLWSRRSGAEILAVHQRLLRAAWLTTLAGLLIMVVSFMLHIAILVLIGTAVLAYGLMWVHRGYRVRRRLVQLAFGLIGRIGESGH